MKLFGNLKRFWVVKKHYFLIALLNILALLIVAFLSYAFYVDYINKNVFLSGISLGNVRVGSHTFKNSLKLVDKHLSTPMKKPFLFKWGSSSNSNMPLKDIIDVDARSMVRHGIYVQDLIPVWIRVYHRVFNNPVDLNIPLNMSYDCSKLQARLNIVAKRVFVPARDATTSVSPETVRIIPSKRGHKMDFDYAWKESIKSIPTKNRVLKLKLIPVEPRVREKDIGKTITIDKGGHTLRLFKGAKKVKEYPIACGSPSYPTPTGQFKIVEKRRYPTWTNPHKGWSAGMPEYISPGPGNPLGTRAMDLDASGIRIHGTPSPWSIGSSVSHGCIRMYISDAEDLFDRVEEGIPVYIFSG